MIIVKAIGGLGNQMFQYALYRSMKEIYPDTKLDILSFESYKLHNGFELETIFANVKIEYANYNEVRKLSSNNKNLISIIRRLFGLNRKHYYENSLGYNEDVKSISENKYFEGYWQSEKYFADIKDIIREEYTFSPFIDKKNIIVSDKMRKTNSISIHIRRGDFVNNQLYSGICTEEYYQNAINYIKRNINDPYFYVFSDDIPWSKKNLDQIDQVEFIDWNKGEISYRDMQLMSICKHNIIANSTFSWWGAWLNSNPDKIVVAPKKILNSDNDAIDLIPENWIRF